MRHKGYCGCSAFGDSKVHLYSCVLERGGSPCFLLLPESWWYDEKKHKLGTLLFRFMLHIKHPFWGYRHRHCEAQIKEES